VVDVEEYIPSVFNLVNPETDNAIDSKLQVTQVAMEVRQDLVASLANVDLMMEEYFLMEEQTSSQELWSALRRATLDRKILPVMTGAVLKEKGVEPLLDALADFLPSPLHQQPSVLINQDPEGGSIWGRKKQKALKKGVDKIKEMPVADKPEIQFGHPLHPSLLALAFKVVHTKNRGGSGDGGVVFVPGALKRRFKWRRRILPKILTVWRAVSHPMYCQRRRVAILQEASRT